jgi:hypothetical protein
MAKVVPSLRTKKLNSKDSAKQISLSNHNEQLNKIPVTMNGFTAYSDISEVPTMEEISTKRNNSDTVLINNIINSKSKYSAQNTLTGIKSDSEHSSKSLSVTVTLEDVQPKLETSLTIISVLQDL